MKLKEFFCKLFCKLPSWLRNTLCWVWRHVVGTWKFYMSADTWKDLWGFIESIMDDFNYAFKILAKKVFKGEKPPPIPLEKITPALPGDNSRIEIAKQGMIGCLILGVFLGSVITNSAVNNSVSEVVWTIIVACLLCLLPVLFYKMDTYRLGWLGERFVAKELKKYGHNRNWRIFHAFFVPDPKYKGDIDHIVVCPNGVFCVETKAQWIPKKVDVTKNGETYIAKSKNRKCPTGQAKGNARRLRNFLNNKLNDELDDESLFNIQFVVPVVFFVNTKFVPDYVTHDLIIGNAKRVKDVFDKHEKVLFEKHGKERNLTLEQIDEISKVLERQRRADIEKYREFLEE